MTITAISQVRYLRTFINRFRKRAAGRNIHWNYSVNALIKQWTMQGGICSLTGAVLRFAISSYWHERGLTNVSLDRIDSTRGYTANNVQLVHKQANTAKSNTSDELHVAYCSLVCNHAGILQLDSSQRNEYEVLLNAHNPSRTIRKVYKSEIGRLQREGLLVTANVAVGA